MAGDRALDVQIDTVIFGHEVFDHESGPYRVGGYGDAGRVPNYSTDIAAAWQIVERAIDYQFFSGGLVSHSLPLGVSEDQQHRAQLWFGIRGLQTAKVGSALAPTLPEAICRAALSDAAGREA